MNRYRIVVSTKPTTEGDEPQSGFVASAPELPQCRAEGETRADAVARLEEEISSCLQNMEEQGVVPPVPLDTETYSGELTVKVSPALHSDLVWAAREAGVSLEVLLTEVLTRGVSRGRGGRPRASDGSGNRRSEGGHRSGRGSQDRRYHDIMENRADFIEYVRQLDREPRRGGGRGGRGGHR